MGRLVQAEDATVTVQCSHTCLYERRLHEQLTLRYFTWGLTAVTGCRMRLAIWRGDADAASYVMWALCRNEARGSVGDIGWQLTDL